MKAYFMGLLVEKAENSRTLIARLWCTSHSCTKHQKAAFRSISRKQHTEHKKCMY